MNTVILGACLPVMKVNLPVLYWGTSLSRNEYLFPTIRNIPLTQPNAVSEGYFCLSIFWKSSLAGDVSAQPLIHSADVGDQDTYVLVELA